MRNTEITERTQLLNQDGMVKSPGFARKMLWEYDRKSLKTPRFRMKEWDYYLVMSEQFGVAFTI